MPRKHKQSTPIEHKISAVRNNIEDDDDEKFIDI